MLLCGTYKNYVKTLITTLLVVNMSITEHLSCHIGQSYTMAAVVDGVIDSQTLLVFETLLAEAAKFQTMTSPSSEKPISICFFFFFLIDHRL